MIVHRCRTLLIGIIAGTLSTVGYKYIMVRGIFIVFIGSISCRQIEIYSIYLFSIWQPFLSSKLKIHDTCGVNNLHGMPGVLAGIIGAIAAAAFFVNGM